MVSSTRQSPDIRERILPEIYSRSIEPPSPHLLYSEELQIVYGEDRASYGDPAEEVCCQQQQHEGPALPVPQGHRGVRHPEMVDHLDTVAMLIVNVRTYILLNKMIALYIIS